MAVSTTSTLSANMYEYYVRTLLKVLQPRLQLYKLGKKTSLPKNTGKQVKWLLYAKLASSTSALTEGTNPSETSLTSSNVTATVAQYGQYAKVSDLLSFTSIDDTIKEHAEIFGKAGAESVEDLIVAQLDSALTARRVNARADDDSIVAGDVITMKEFLKSQIALKNSFVGPHEMGNYMAVLHADNEYDILTETNPSGWLPASQYIGEMQKGIIRGEIGRMFGMRFLTSDKMNKADNASSISVHNNYLIGEECFGVVEIAPKGGRPGVDMIVKGHDSGGQANPLNMYGTVGYKLRGFVAKNFAAARGILLKGATSFA
jgi:N4-gp56 family major capsid protein